jgi:hypothetical protein
VLLVAGDGQVRSGGNQAVPYPRAISAQQPPILEGGSLAVSKEPLPDQVERLIIKGWRVESQTEETAVMIKGESPEHMLHFVLTVLTFGFWAIVWIFLAIFKQEDRMVLTAPGN